MPAARINAAPATAAVFVLVQATIFNAPWMRVEVELSHTLWTALQSNRHARCRFTFSTTSNAMVIVEKRRRAAAGREAFVWDLRIAQSVWSAPALAALSGGRRGWKDGCPPCGQKAVLKSPPRRAAALRRRKSRRSASSGDDQISRSVLECASPLALWGRTHFTLSTTSSSVKMNAVLPFMDGRSRARDCVRHAGAKVGSAAQSKRQRPIEPPFQHPS